MRRFINKLLLTIGVIAPVIAAVPVRAATIVVSPSAMNGWSIDKSADATVSFNSDASAPMATGSAKLTTSSSNDSYAQLDHPLTSPVALSTISAASYVYKVETANMAEGALSFYMQVDKDGDLATSDTAYLVYEPYWSDGLADAAPVVRGVWQTGDVSTGMLWCTGGSFGSVACSPAGPSTINLTQAKAEAPNAKVLGYGVFQGTYNPDYVTYLDSVTINSTTFNFDVDAAANPMPTNKDQCKKDGWKTYAVFKNQGDCVSYVATGGNNKPANGSSLRF